MSDPTYRYGRARPEYPVDPTQRMEPLRDDYGQRRPRRPSRVNAARLWAGGAGTALVVALTIVVGVLLVRGVLGIPVLAAQGEGVYGNANTTSYALTGALLALLACGLLHLLLLAMPNPMGFFYWICLLVTAMAVLLPFTLVATFEAQVATAGINVVAGLCLMTILGSIGNTAQNPQSGGW